MNTISLNKFRKQLEEALNQNDINKIGIEVGFSKRLRIITPFLFVMSLISTLGSKKVESIADLHRGFNYMNRVKTAYKAFYNRLARKGFPALMKRMCYRLVSTLAVKTLDFQEDSPLNRFDDIIIQDGSSYALKKNLSEVFPGRFTAIEPAAVEIHASFSAKMDSVFRVSITPDSSSERDELPAPHTLKNRLLLGDRGYPSVLYFNDVKKAGGSFLMWITTSWKPRVHGYFVDGELHFLDHPTPLCQILAQNQGKTFDLEVSFAKDGHKSRHRLVIFKNTSKRKVKKPHKKDPWVRLCTNLSAKEFSTNLVGKLYRFRWQIELVFKEWKSYSNLHKFNTSDPNIAKGLIWASLCAAIVKRFLAHSCSYVAGKEISTRRVAMCASHFLPNLIKCLVTQNSIGFRREWKEAMEFLGQNAVRANPSNDYRKGRLSAGLKASIDP